MTRDAAKTFQSLTKTVPKTWNKGVVLITLSKRTRVAWGRVLDPSLGDSGVKGLIAMVGVVDFCFGRYMNF